ncbi:MAG TPA: PPA1309 family protein [Jiangellales bacterium]|nr:PPA1309 family protein [Jiangellales bacterium]
MTSEGVPAALPGVVAEIERHVAGGGWDQPPRLYALADTADMLAREPALADALGLAEGDGQGLTPVEQEDLPQDRPLDEVLASIVWPPSVAGCALAIERIVLPPHAEEGMPGEDEAAAEWAASHPDRADVRIVVGVLRDGTTSCVLRVRGHEAPEDLVREPEVSTDLVNALVQTLEE